MNGNDSQFATPIGHLDDISMDPTQEGFYEKASRRGTIFLYEQTGNTQLAANMAF